MLAIGIVVDDAIIVIENVERILKEEQLPVKDAVTKAMQQVTGPIIATTLVLLAVFVPVGFMPGITGELYKQFSVTISCAVLISSVNALPLQAQLGSLYINDFNQFGRTYKVMIQADAAYRTQAADLQHYYVRNTQGIWYH